MSSTPNLASIPNVSWTTLTAANNVYDGTGTVGTACTFGTGGSFVGYLKAKPLGTNVASVARIWINNGGTNATATNNALWGEITLPATTASATAPLAEVLYPLNFGVNAGFKLNVALGTAVAAGWTFTVVAGDL